MQSWQALVVERMCELKVAGMAFDDAWRTAIVTHPPRGRDCGPERPSLLDRDESVVACFERACRDAWFGDRPALAHFSAALLVTTERSGPALRRTA